SLRLVLLTTKHFETLSGLTPALKVIPSLAKVRDPYNPPMGRRWTALIVVVALGVLTLAGALLSRRRSGRPAGVPATAAFVDGKYIDCMPGSWGFGGPCKVYDSTSGKLVDTDPFSIRLGAFSKQQGGSPIDCGKTSSKAADPKVAECVQAAFKRHSPFT